MNALDSLGAGGHASADAENVTALLRSTNEVEHRVQVSNPLRPNPLAIFQAVVWVVCQTLLQSC